MFNPEAFSNAFPPPPAGMRVYRKSFIYTSADALADICADDYFAAVAESLGNGDFVTITSTHESDGCENLCHWVGRTEGGAVYVNLPMQPRSS